MTGFVVPTLPILYLFGASAGYLVCVNFVAGVVWSGLSLAMGNSLFETVASENRARAVAVTSVVNATGWFSGAILGEWSTGLLSNRRHLLGQEMLQVSNLLLRFLLSGGLRFVVAWCFLPHLRETREVERLSAASFLTDLPLR